MFRTIEEVLLHSRRCFTIQKGRIIEGSGQNIKVYGSYEGFLVRAGIGERQIRNRPQEYWTFLFISGPNLAELTLQLDSAIAFSILNSLSGCEKFGLICLQPWLTSQRKPRISVYNDGRELTWRYTIAEMPALKLVSANGREVFDATDRIEFFRKVLKNDILPRLPGELLENIPI